MTIKMKTPEMAQGFVDVFRNGLHYSCRQKGCVVLCDTTACYGKMIRWAKNLEAIDREWMRKKEERLENARKRISSTEKRPEDNWRVGYSQNMRRVRVQRRPLQGMVTSNRSNRLG